MRTSYLVTLLVALLLCVTSCDKSSSSDPAVNDNAVNQIVGQNDPVNPGVDGFDDNGNENFDVVLQDSDNWLLQLNTVAVLGSRIKYTGRLYYMYGGQESIGDAIAIYDRINDVLVYSGIDQAWNGRQIVYALPFTGETSLYGPWMYTYSGNGLPIHVTLIQGTMDDHSATAKTAASTPVQAVLKHHDEK